MGLIRWAARLLSIVSATMLLLFLFGAERFEVSKFTATEWLGVAFFPFGVVV